MSNRRFIKIFLLLFVCLTEVISASAGDSSLDPYLIPWEYESISEISLLDGELHFFFMAGEG